MSDPTAKLNLTNKGNEMNEIYIDTCPCDDDEHELLVMATDLVCPGCREHEASCHH